MNKAPLHLAEHLHALLQPDITSTICGTIRSGPISTILVQIQPVEKRYLFLQTLPYLCVDMMWSGGSNWLGLKDKSTHLCQLNAKTYRDFGSRPSERGAAAERSSGQTFRFTFLQENVAISNNSPCQALLQYYVPGESLMQTTSHHQMS